MLVKNMSIQDQNSLKQGFKIEKKVNIWGSDELI